jgi:hypothetical protein
MEAEAERLAQRRTTLRQKIQEDGKRVVTDDLMQALTSFCRETRKTIAGQGFQAS